MVLLTRDRTTMPPRVSHRQRVTDDIRARIVSGEWPPGYQLPSLRDLVLRYGCSEGPIKRAIDDLKLLGWLEGHQGKGVFVVADPPDRTNPTGRPSADQGMT